LIPYSTQHITLLDRFRVFRALGSPYLTQGPAVEKFEKGVAKYVGAEHAVAVNSATSALHIACLALGLGPGDIMWTSPISFVASANCGRYCGAEVDFVDIDPETFNMSPNELRTKLETAEKEGRLPKVIVVVHLAGEPAEMDKISILARKYGVKIIEDASHALGSSYQGQKVGSGAFSDVTVFSFHAVKNITTGEGGMVVAKDLRLAESMRAIRSHGITRLKASFQVEAHLRTPWHYEQQTLGFNFRMTDFQAILGLSQLSRLEKHNSLRRRIVVEYKKVLGDYCLVSFQDENLMALSAAHLAIVRVPREKRNNVATDLGEQGIATNLHYFPIHLQPYYASKARSLPNAEKYAAEALSLPCHPKLSLRVTRKIARALRLACQVEYQQKAK
jgi:UDP-4-amino-4,6-dideoxy-N-acetyl-beta-L-altrosamine transaminase